MVDDKERESIQLLAGRGLNLSSAIYRKLLGLKPEQVTEAREIINNLSAVCRDINVRIVSKSRKVLPKNIREAELWTEKAKKFLGEIRTAI